MHPILTKLDRRGVVYARKWAIVCISVDIEGD